MKTTVLAAALLAAFSMPAFAEDAVQTDDAAKITVDPVTTSATPTDQSHMPKTAIKKHGCMHRNTAMQMM